ncbi:hypothetical protein E2C01_022492 [Portunus trituberculatus]|uniref:Uncharacterized protein n=1 Tax=Portunus trituberculatus TaxID=210409 RepID=A0A5B7E649_PORTR|nr:hypothetical protein [Portunus trituberculatus]
MLTHASQECKVSGFTVHLETPERTRDMRSVAGPRWTDLHGGLHPSIFTMLWRFFCCAVGLPAVFGASTPSSQHDKGTTLIVEAALRGPTPTKTLRAGDEAPPSNTHLAPVTCQQANSSSLRV